MKLIKYGAGLLFFALCLTAVMVPAAAYETTEWIEGSDGYMVNNIIIEAGSIGVSTDDNSNNTSGNVSISIYEWKNDSWTRLNGTKLGLNQTMSFQATDGNYTVRAIDFREIGRFNEVKLEIWTNANVSNSGYIDGGHSNAEGAGRPELVITKVVTPSSSVSVDDIITVMIYVNNTGNYDAKNVTITDPYQQGFLMSNVTINNTVNQTINRNTNSTYLAYQLKAVEPGTYTLSKTTASAENNVGGKFNYTQSNDVRIEVSDLAALTFSASPLSGNTVDYYTRSKIEGNITIRNTGTMPAQYVGIEFTLPDGATISGKEITVTGGKATVYIDQIMPNNQKTIEYSLSASAEGVYSVPITYNYTYNSSAKNGTIQTVSFNAVGSSAIGSFLDYWFLIFIPIILILVAALFLWKRHREYKF
ncbi:hypothetical protein MmiAt1_17860 [Methanimicrococcus sp. At1]|uniref:DUF11 domain-containing protein n=1 Tax=Methanimicrococcus hacksteinii TaxID=3028293 RepID=A0ABU3VRY0_9EURY|nr:hypothetical protein [Methanimicrococcus sp. At1]MDV0446168.1 hypothetical protein [Methanimicrococcus sp. At1]